MKSRLTETGETLLGAVWLGPVWVWGGLMTAMIVLAPLLLANLAVEIRDSLPATVALAGGVVGAYAIGLPPWDADEPESLSVVVAGAAVSAVVWDLMRGSADVVTLLVTLGVTAVGWPARRFMTRLLSADR